MDPQPSDFEFGRQLANGSFGCVRLVRHKVTARVYAVKMMAKGRVRHQMVVNEVALHRRLEHQNVVRLHAYFATADHHCLLLHFAVGGNLGRYIDRHVMVEEKAITFFRQIVSGVDYLHSMKIVHRDLKPLNVVLDKGDVALIADFGTATDLAVEKPRGNVGTVIYSAPEVMAAEEFYDTAADVWSLGATLAHMVTGQLPTVDLLREEEARHEAVPANFSAGCHDLLTALLQEHPAARPTAAEILHHHWLSA